MIYEGGVLYEFSYDTIEQAVKEFNGFRRTNPQTWTWFVVHAPTGAQVQVKLFGKRTIGALRVLRDGQVLRFPSLWDAKVGDITRTVKQALEEAYGE